MLNRVASVLRVQHGTVRQQRSSCGLGVLLRRRLDRRGVASKPVHLNGTHRPAIVADPVVRDFKIVDTTLREGEQFATAEFSSRDRLYIAKTLDVIGVDYIELVNPLASKQAIRDCEDIAKLDLKVCSCLWASKPRECV